MTQRDAHRWGLQELANAGFKVAVWEVAPITLPAAEHHDSERPPGFSVVRFASLPELESACSRLTTAHAVIALLGRKGASLDRCMPVMRCLANSSALWCAASFRAAWESALPDVQNSAFSPGRSTLGFMVVRVINGAKSAVKRWLAGIGKGVTPGASIRPLDIAWVATSREEFDHRLLGRDSRVVPVHALDVDRIAGIADQADTKPFLVYVDGLGPLHPDNITLSTESPGAPPEVYFGELTKACDWIERMSGLPIIVAAHPRAPRDGTLERWYAPHQVTYESTASLVSAATGVVLSYPSDSVSMAVFCRKPIVIVTSKKFPRDERVMARGLARMLKSPLIHLERPPARWPGMAIDDHRYDSLAQRYVKSRGTRPGRYWDVVAADLRGVRRPAATGGG